MWRWFAIRINGMPVDASDPDQLQPTPMNKVFYPITLIVLVLTFGCAAKDEPAAAKGPPNIVLVIADDMGYECLGANGGAELQYAIPRQSSPRGHAIRTRPLSSPFAHQVGL